MKKIANPFQSTFDSSSRQITLETVLERLQSRFLLAYTAGVSSRMNDDRDRVAVEWGTVNAIHALAERIGLIDILSESASKMDRRLFSEVGFTQGQRIEDAIRTQSTLFPISTDEHTSPRLWDSIFLLTVRAGHLHGVWLTSRTVPGWRWRW